MKRPLFLLCFLLLTGWAAAQTGSLNKIPLNGKNFYQLNNLGDNTTATSGLQQLCDSDVSNSVFMGWGKLLGNYDCYYEFKGLDNVLISKIRFYDGQGSFENQPFKVYAKASAGATPALIATFTGAQYNSWVEVNLPQPVPAKYLVMNVHWGFPNEMELYGSYSHTNNLVLSPTTSYTFNQQCSINSFIWNFMQNFIDVNLRDSVYAANWNLMKGFSGYRDYVDWEKIEPQQGVFYFDHTLYGGWNYDKLYQKLNAENKNLLVCFKTLPGWFVNANYPPGEQDAENTPAPYTSNWQLPSSYILQAKAAFQFAARYGSHAVDTNLLPGVVTGKVWAGDPNSPVRAKKTGLGYVKYMECENERDKWWKGRKAYQTGREYAANLSAFYDGHKGTMGNNVGVKTADPSMKIVIGGIASTQTDYIRAIIDWCKEFRGYKPNGSVDLCFDAINYHCYTNDAQVSQSGTATRGAAPEVANSGEWADAMVSLGREYGVEVWITETGYDYNPSPQGVMSIGSKSKSAVQADWILRTALLNSRHGIARTYFYTSYDEHAASYALFGTSGLLDEATRTRKSSADYLIQAARLIGNYTIQSTATAPGTGVITDVYGTGTSKVWVVMKPTENGSSAPHTINLSTNKAYIYTPTAGQDTMSRQTVNTINGELTLTATETPVFIVAYEEPVVIPTGVNHIATSTIQLDAYPNPANGHTTISYNSKENGPVEISLYNAAGMRCRSFSFVKKGPVLKETLSLAGLSNGIYTIELQQGTNKGSARLVKMD